MFQNILNFVNFSLKFDIYGMHLAVLPEPFDPYHGLFFRGGLKDFDKFFNGFHGLAIHIMDDISRP